MLRRRHTHVDTFPPTDRAPNPQQGHADAASDAGRAGASAPMVTSATSGAYAVRPVYAPVGRRTPATPPGAGLLARWARRYDATVDPAWPLEEWVGPTVILARGRPLVPRPWPLRAWTTVAHVVVHAAIQLRGRWPASLARRRSRPDETSSAAIAA